MDTQWRSMEKMRGLEHLYCEEILRKLRMFSLEKRRLQGDFVMAFQYTKGPCKE